MFKGSGYMESSIFIFKNHLPHTTVLRELLFLFLVHTKSVLKHTMYKIHMYPSFKRLFLDEVVVKMVNLL